MLLDPEVCTHDDFLISPKVEKVFGSPNGPVVDYILKLSIRCSRCHLPFKFRGPIIGIVLNQPVISENEMILNCPIEPSTESRKYIVSKAGEG